MENQFIKSTNFERNMKTFAFLFLILVVFVFGFSGGYFYRWTKYPSCVHTKTNLTIKSNCIDSQLVGDSKKYLGDKKLLLPPGFNSTIEGNEAIKQLYLAYLNPKTNTIVLENTEMSLLLNKFVYSQNHLPTTPNAYGVVEPIERHWGMRSYQLDLYDNYLMVYDGDHPIGKITEKDAPAIFQAILRDNE